MIIISFIMSLYIISSVQSFNVCSRSLVSSSKRHCRAGTVMMFSARNNVAFTRRRCASFTIVGKNDMISSINSSVSRTAFSFSSSSALSMSSRTTKTTANDLYYMAPTLASVQNELGKKKKDTLYQQKKQPYSSVIASVNSTKNHHQRQQQQQQSSNIFTTDGLLTNQPGLNPNQNTRHAPLVYHEHYSCPNWPAKHTFPMAKFKETAVSLLNDPDEFLLLEQEQQEEEEEEEGEGAKGDVDNHHDNIMPLVISQEHFYKPLPTSNFPKSFLSPPICPTYLQSFLAGTLSYEECRTIGFREQTSRPELIERSVLEVAGTVLTAQLAMKYGLASNLAGGTHHATYNQGRGFTILNDLAVVARLMTWKDEEGEGYSCNNNEGEGVVESNEERELLNAFYRGGNDVNRVLVVDTDVHQGDGTATFSYPPTSTTDDNDQKENGHLHNKLFTLDLHARNNYPHPKEKCTYDIGLPDDCTDELYLSSLTASLGKALHEVQPNLVLYNAGVDIYKSDKLGRLSVSWEGMKQRDIHVLSTCVDAGIPVAAVVGGGYDNDPVVVGRRHALVSY